MNMGCGDCGGCGKRHVEAGGENIGNATYDDGGSVACLV